MDNFSEEFEIAYTELNKISPSWLLNTNYDFFGNKTYTASENIMCKINPQSATEKTVIDAMKKLLLKLKQNE